MTEEKKPDWERIRLDYEAGIKTLREIGEDNGLSHVAVDKRAKKEKWVRNLQPRIMAKTAHLVNKQTVNTERRLVTENEIVEANAAQIANTLLAHREYINRHRVLLFKMLKELEVTTDGQEPLEMLLEELLRPEDGEVETGADQRRKDRLRELFHRVNGTAGRVDSLGKLAKTLEILINLERQALRVDDNQDKGSLADFLDGIS